MTVQSERDNRQNWQMWARMDLRAIILPLVPNGTKRTLDFLRTLAAGKVKTSDKAYLREYAHAQLGPVTFQRLFQTL